MKVFISHKDADGVQALQIKKEFEKYGVSAYLDVLDSDIKVGGEQLTNHIRKNLNSCSDLIVVMSEKTKSSWWVPFEIGMSAQIDMPTAPRALRSSEMFRPVATMSMTGKYLTLMKLPPSEWSVVRFSGQEYVYTRRD